MTEHTPQTVTITERLVGCLERQIAAFSGALAEFDAWNEQGATVTPEVLAAQERHLASTRQLEEELHLLLADWRSADPPPSPGERARVATLAGEAQALADDLQQRYETGRARAREQAQALRGNMAGLRAAKTPLRYHPNPGSDPQQVDRKA